MRKREPHWWEKGKRFLNFKFGWCLGIKEGMEYKRKIEEFWKGSLWDSLSMFWIFWERDTERAFTRTGTFKGKEEWRKKEGKGKSKEEPNDKGCHTWISHLRIIKLREISSSLSPVYHLPFCNSITFIFSLVSCHLMFKV